MLGIKNTNTTKMMYVITFVVIGTIIFLTGSVASIAKPRVVEVEGLDNLKFSVTEITATPGEEITVNPTNNSKLPVQLMSHNLVVLKKDTDPAAFNDAVLKASPQGVVPGELNDQLIADTGQVPGGESKSVTFTVPDEPGEYIYICTFPSHFLAGMKGILVVK